MKTPRPQGERSAVSLVTNFLALSGGEFASKAIGFLAFAYLARALGSDGYGALEVAVSLSLFFGIFTDFGFSAIGARQVARDPGTAAWLATRIPVARLVLAAIAAAIMFAIGVAVGDGGPQRDLIWIFSISLVPVALTQRWLFQGLERMRQVATAQALRMAVFALIAIAWIRGPNDLLVAGWAEIAGAVAAAVFLLRAQHRDIGPVRLTPDWTAIRPLAAESFPLGSSRVVATLLQYLPIMFLAAFQSTREAAWFGAAHRVTYSIMTFSWVYHFNLFPSVSREIARGAEGFRTLALRSVRATAWFGALVAVTVGVAAEPLARMIFGSEFGAASVPLSILIWAFPVILFYTHGESALIAEGRQREVLIAQGAGLVATAALGVTIVPAGASGGAAISLLGGMCVVALATATFARRAGLALPLRSVLTATGTAGGIALVLGWADASIWIALPAGAVSVACVMVILDRNLIHDVRWMSMLLFGRPSSSPDRERDPEADA